MEFFFSNCSQVLHQTLLYPLLSKAGESATSLPGTKVNLQKLLNYPFSMLPFSAAILRSTLFHLIYRI